MCLDNNGLTVCQNKLNSVVGGVESRVKTCFIGGFYFYNCICIIKQDNKKVNFDFFLN